MLVRRTVLHVDHAHHPVPRDDRNGEKSFVGVLWQVAEVFEPWIPIRLPGDRQQTPFVRHPPGQAFIEPQPDLPDRRRVRCIGRAQDQFVLVQQVNQAGVAFHEFHNERNNALQDLLETHFLHHEPADALKQAKLLLESLRAEFEIFTLWHDYIIGVREPLG